MVSRRMLDTERKDRNCHFRDSCSVRNVGTETSGPRDERWSLKQTRDTCQSEAISIFSYHPSLSLIWILFWSIIRIHPESI